MIKLPLNLRSKIVLLLSIVVFSLFYSEVVKNDFSAYNMLIPFAFGVTWFLALYFLQESRFGFLISFLIAIAVLLSLMFPFIGLGVDEKIKKEKSINELNIILNP